MISDRNKVPNRVDRFGNSNEAPVISINLKYGRLYFSVFAVKTLNLEKTPFRIFRRGKRWLLSSGSGLTALLMKMHQGAFYVVSKKLSLELAGDYQCEKPSFLIVGADRKRKYYELRFFESSYPFGKKRSTEQPISGDRNNPKLASASRIVEMFNCTNFPGRVKTKDIILAEQRLNGN